MMNTPRATGTIPRFVPLEGSERASVIAVFVFAVFSTLVLSVVLLCVVSVAFSAVFKRTSYQNLSREAFFFRSQLGQYAGCLLLSNWIRGISGWIDIKWISGGGVRAGSSCSAQGAIKMIGQFGSFFFVVAMGIHTFNTLVLRNRPPQWLGIVVTFVGWTSSLIVGLAPLSISGPINGPLYDIDGFTCGISKSWQVAHMLLYFFPLFLASLLSAIVYSLIFLMLRGTLVINGGLKIHLDPERRSRFKDGTFEGYQRFVFSVAQKMLWLPISFILALLPSSIVQLMDISRISVSPGIMAFSYILEYLDGVINVLILFNVLRALGPAMRSTGSADPEKSRPGRPTISRPKHDWKPPAMFSSLISGPVRTSAPPARPPDSIRRGNVSGPSSLPKFLSHKKTGSSNSSTRLLTTEPPLRFSSPSPSLDRSKFATSSVLVAPAPVELSVPPQAIRKPAPTSIVDVELSAPPQANRIHTQTGPQLRLLTSDLSPQPNSDPTGLAPSPRAKRSRVSRDGDLNLISESPTTAAASPSDAPFLEVTLHSPRSSVTGHGVSSLISMYLSRDSSTFVELPPFPAAAVPHDPSVDLPVIVPDEGAGFSLKPAVSVGAVGGGHLHRPTSTHPELPSPVPLASPGHSTDPSQYSDSEVDSPPPPPLPSKTRPALHSTQPLRVSRTTSVDAPSRASRDRHPAEKVDAPQRHRHISVRALPKPPDRPAPSRTSSARSHITSQTSGHSRNGSSSSSHYSTDTYRKERRI